jgi:hypothetical protein
VPWYYNSCQIEHSERAFGTALTRPMPSHGKSIHHRLTKWLPFQQSVVGVCCNLQEVTALWRFSGRSDCSLDVVVLQRGQSEGDMNNFEKETASVIKGSIAQEDQALPKRSSRGCVKVSFGALGSLCLEPVEICRYRSPWSGKFLGNACSYAHTNCSWYRNWSLMIRPSDWRFVRKSWVWWKEIRFCRKG